MNRLVPLVMRATPSLVSLMPPVPLPVGLIPVPNTLGLVLVVGVVVVGVVVVGVLLVVGVEDVGVVVGVVELVVGVVPAWLNKGKQHIK
jgi:hypothetical protein